MAKNKEFTFKYDDGKGEGEKTAIIKNVRREKFFGKDDEWTYYFDLFLDGTEQTYVCDIISDQALSGRYGGYGIIDEKKYAGYQGLKNQDSTMYFIPDSRGLEPKTKVLMTYTKGFRTGLPLNQDELKKATLLELKK